jgi:hypothetical protein
LKEKLKRADFADNLYVPDRAEQGAVALILQGSVHGSIKTRNWANSEGTDWTVSRGSAVPVRVKVSHPARRSMNLTCGNSDCTAIIASLAACVGVEATK